MWPQIIGGVLGGLIGGQDQKTTATSQPWGPTQDFLKQILGQGSGIYNAGFAPYYPGPTTLGASPLQQAAFGGALPAANLGMHMLNTANRGALNLYDRAQQMPMGGVNALSGLIGAAPMQGVDALMGAAQSPYLYGNFDFSTPHGGGRAIEYLTDPSILSPETNPYLQKYGDALTSSMTQNFQENIMPGLRLDAAQTGGFGSSDYGKHAVMASQRAQDEISKNLAGMYNQAYGQGLQALGQGGQLAAQLRGQTLSTQLGELGHLTTQRGQGLNALQSAANALANMYGTQMSGAGSMANALANMWGTGLGAQSRAIDMGYRNAMTPMNMAMGLLGMGGTQRGIGLEQLGADKARWDYYQNPWSQLSPWASLVTQIAGLGGQQTGTRPGDPFGGALAGLQLGQGLFPTVPQ